MSARSQATYLAPLRFRGLTRFYDALMRWTLRESRWRPALVAQTHCAPGERVLDLGCGTGTLTVLLARTTPAAQIVGLDPDPEALEIARAKAARAGMAIGFRQARAEDAELELGSFDRVVTSLVLHHLSAPAKCEALARARAWLRPGGEIHVADWGRARSRLQRLAFLPVQLLDGFENTRDHVRAGLEDYLREAGFEDVEETRSVPTVLGTLCLYRGRRPDDSDPGAGSPMRRQRDGKIDAPAGPE